MSDYVLWTIRAYVFNIVHIVHNLKHFGKALTALWQSVGQVDTLDGSNKSLAYNIAAVVLYRLCD